MSFPGNLFGKRRGATEAEIAEVENAISLIFPQSYRKFLTESDGMEFKKQEVKILSLKESLEYFEGIRAFGLTETWGYFPILDNQDSNPWCICCKEPLAGYIVQVVHDDSAHVKFRSLENFIRCLQKGPAGDACFLEDFDGVLGDFRKKERTSQDMETARLLLKMAQNCSESDRQDACRFAMWLLSEDELDEIVPLLYDADVFTARDAVDRLTAMRSGSAAQALKIWNQDLADFVEKSHGLLTQAGIQASIEHQYHLRLGTGNVMLDMKFFFASRNEPGAEQHFIERAKSFTNET